MSILVTGGSGFIGSNFLKYLIEKYPDRKVINFSKTPNTKLEQELEETGQYQFIKGDITDEEAVSSAMARVKFLFHLAAESQVGVYSDGGKRVLEVNEGGTENVLRAAKATGVERVVLLSSSEVYGGGSDGLFIENDTPRSENQYGQSKIKAETLGLQYHRERGLDVVILRPNNIFGPWQRPPKIIPNIAKKLLSGEDVELNGDGKNLRTYLQVNDFCRAMDLAYQKGESGEVYNVSSSLEITNLALAKRIARLLDCAEDRIVLMPDRDSGIMRRAVSSDKLRTLGWTQGGSFERDLERTIDWYKENQDWLLK